MTACDDYISKVEQMLPDLATTKDLIKAGIYRSDQAASAARRKGQAPSFFRFNKRVVIYPKQGVIEFLKRAKNAVCHL